MINVEALSLAFGAGAKTKQVLSEVAFTVARGESFGLVGESGSGKTTVLRCLAGLYKHWHGQV